MENLIGFILPPVIELINHKVENPTFRFALAIVVSIVVAVVINYQKLAISTPDQLLASAALLFSEAQIAYRLYWHADSPVRQMIGK
jgi:hypothetical protein